MTEEQTEYEVVEEAAEVPAVRDPNQLLAYAIGQGAAVETLEKLMALQERHEANEARKAFSAAKAAFKAEAPPVKKDKYNKFFDSWYTSLGNLLDTYNPILGKHGLSLSFEPKQTNDDSMTVAATLSHSMGHSESLSMTAPIDKAAVGKQSGQRSRTPIQDVKSTFTYLRSATCEAILGVSGTEASAADDDGNGAGGRGNAISSEQADKLELLIEETGTNRVVFLKAFKVDRVDRIPAGRFDEAMRILSKKQGK